MKYLKIFKNWRLIALAVTAIAALLLLAGDGNKFNVIMGAKVIGCLLCYFGYKTGKEWYEDGKIDEINAFKCDE